MPDAIDRYAESLQKKKAVTESQSRRAIMLYMGLRRRKQALSIILLCIGFICTFTVGIASYPFLFPSSKSELNDLVKEKEGLETERSRLMQRNRFLESQMQEQHPFPLAASLPNPPALQSVPLPPLKANRQLADQTDDPDIKDLLDPDAAGWKNRYEYAAIKYNKIVDDYNKLRNQYFKLVGGKNGKVPTATGVQVIRAMFEDNKAKIEELNEKIKRGGALSGMNRLRKERDELQDREMWLRKIARSFEMTP